MYVTVIGYLKSEFDRRIQDFALVGNKWNFEIISGDIVQVELVTIEWNFSLESRFKQLSAEVLQKH